jgi:hypothetical protein
VADSSLATQDVAQSFVVFGYASPVTRVGSMGDNLIGGFLNWFAYSEFTP